MSFFRTKANKSAGFTLIELMIVVAIMGVLASIALSQYLDDAPKAQVAGALAEITPVKGMIEEKINEGLTVDEAAALSGKTATPLGNLGISSTSSQRCSEYISSVSIDGTGSIICTMTGAWAVEGKTLQWSRTAGGVWTCTSDVDEKYRPKGCNAA
jgi:type IV pilus assembly protein PilA